MILNNTDLWVFFAIPQKRKQKTFNLYPQIAFRLNWMLMWEPKCGKWCEKVDTMANYFRCNSSDAEKKCCQLNYWKIVKFNASASLVQNEIPIFFSDYDSESSYNMKLSWKHWQTCTFLKESLLLLSACILTILFIENSSLNVIK